MARLLVAAAPHFFLAFACYLGRYPLLIHKKFMRKIAFLYFSSMLCGLVFSSPTSADFYLAQDLNETCAEEDSHSQGLCMGYILGSYSSYARNDARNDVEDCLERINPTAGQLTAIVKKNLKNKPEQWHLPASWLVYSIIREQFCPSKPSKIEATYRSWYRNHVATQKQPTTANTSKSAPPR